MEQGKKNKVFITIISIGITLVVVSILGFYFVYGDRSLITSSTDEMSVCIILPEEYCSTGVYVELDTVGTIGYAFNVSDGTPIYMPYEGSVIDESPGDNENSILRLTTTYQDISVFFIGNYEPNVGYGEKVIKGEQVATIKNDINNEEAYNLVIYSDRLDLGGFFDLTPEL